MSTHPPTYIGQPILRKWKIGIRNLTASYITFTVNVYLYRLVGLAMRDATDHPPSMYRVANPRRMGHRYVIGPAEVITFTVNVMRQNFDASIF